MKKLSFAKSKGASKGFYIALAISVAAVGTVTYLTLSRLNQPQAPGSSLNNTLENSVTDWSIPETSSTNKQNTGVPKDTQKVTSSQSSTRSSSQITSSAGSSQGSNSSGSSEAPTVKNNGSDSGTSSQPAAGAFMAPVSGDILNPFSDGELVKSKTLKEWRTHDGVDFKAAEGTPVKSISDGKVLDIREDSRWGVTIEVEYPDGITAVYNGLSSDVKVKKGQSVKMGDVIGTVGNTSIIEAAEEMHLHLGLKKDNQWIDPMSVIVKA